MPKKHSVNQKNAAIDGFSPNNADLQITTPLTSIGEMVGNLHKLGLTASDLKPIDWRKKVKLDFVKNQGACGNCWAQSSTSALTDRFIIKKNIKNLNLDPLITTQCVMNMGRQNMGCGGGLPQAAGQFFERVGAVDTSDTCLPWKQMYHPGTRLPLCQQIEKQCGLGQPGVTIYKAVPNSTQSLGVGNASGIDAAGTIINMKRELAEHGPFPVAYFVPHDFIATQVGFKWDKTNGIYINGAYNDELDKTKLNPVFYKHFGNPKGKEWADITMENGRPAGHAVELVGWGIGNAGSYGKTPYWIIKNSWGPNWNESGYFRYAMCIAPHFHNKYLGLDVPIRELTIVSTMAKKPLGGSFGGGTRFLPDLNTGAPHGHSLPVKKHDNGNTNNKSVWGKWWMIMLYVLIVIGIIYILYILYGKGNRKRKRKRK